LRATILVNNQLAGNAGPDRDILKYLFEFLFLGSLYTVLIGFAPDFSASCTRRLQPLA
jgi:hypothetical protein